MSRPSDQAPSPSAYDRQAFCAAALGCKERLWGYALQLTRDRAQAEDLLQLTYVRAFEHWQQLRELERVAGWLLRTMHRAFVDQCRATTRAAEDPLEVVLEVSEARESGPAERTVARDSVQRALSQLAPSLAQAITLRDVWGFSYEEIAELMGCPVGTVRSRIARARAQMLEHLGMATMDGNAAGAAATEGSVASGGKGGASR